MLTRKCDICGAEMRMTTPRYKVTFDGWLYKSEKDICVPCFERIKAEIQTADTPQTETKGVRYCNECKWFRNKQVCGRCRSRNLFAEADAPQTERMTEEEIDTMLAKVLVGQTDCGWK